jgi:ABC-type transporter Mla MlaB component
MSFTVDRSLDEMALPRPAAAVFTVRGPIERDDLPGLSDRICALLDETGARVAFCDVEGVEADAVTADALARLQLAARRKGCQIRMRGASRELRGLIAFMGLDDVLPDGPL